MKRLLIIFSFAVISNGLAAQNYWSLGTYFIPAVVNYSFARQNTNLNFLSGVSLSKKISKKISVTTGISYFKNRLYGDTNTCYACAANTIKTQFRARFIEIPIGLKYTLKPLYPFNNMTPGIMAGLISNFNFDSHESDFDYGGTEHSFYRRRLHFHKIYGYIGLNLMFNLNNYTTLSIDPLLRFSPGTGIWGESLISYDTMFGIGVGVSVRLN